VSSNSSSQAVVSRVFRLGKMTLGPGYIAYENRTASGRVTLTPEQEKKWREWRMWQGSNQGGGGNEFVFLTGLFASKSGKSITGSISPDAFNTLFAMMQDANSKGVDLVFVVSGPGQNAGPDSKMKGRLSVVVGRPKQQFSAPQAAPAGPFGGRPVAGPIPAPGSAVPTPTPAQGFAFGATQAASNPPPDELEKFLEGFNDK